MSQECRRPLKILIAGAGRHDWHEAAWACALRDLGHDVTTFVTAPMVDSFSRRLSERFLCGSFIDKVNEALMAAADEVAPDVFVGYRALLVTPETVEAIGKRHGSRLVCYQNDNLFGPLRTKAYWRLFRAAIPSFDLHLVYRESDIPRYKRLGANRVRVLRSHYLPWLHRRLEPPSGHSIDVGFYGHCENDVRIRLLDGLMRTVPARFSVRGSGWKRFGKGRPWESLDTSEVQGEAYVRAINKTKIALVFLSRLNEDTYTRRVFEIPASGTFMLCERTRDMLSLYEEGREAAFFDSEAELIEKVRHYLARDAEREAVARAGEQRARESGYDIHSRMRSWLADLEPSSIR
jgi:spore maturation protein CgeB